MQIAVISLERTPDRLAEFGRWNGHLGQIQQLNAIDGHKQDIDLLVRDQLIDPDVLPHYTRGAVGCALSHLALWKRAIDSSQPLTICEDDAVFNHYFRARAEALVRTLPPDWDLVLWGWNFDSVLQFDLLPGASPCLAYFDQQQLRTNIEGYQRLSMWPGLYPLARAFGIPCYSVSPKGAQRLTQYCLPIRPMTVAFPGFEKPLHNNGIDIMMNAIYPKLSAFVAFPPLVITKNEIERTTVQRD